MVAVVVRHIAGVEEEADVDVADDVVSSRQALAIALFPQPSVSVSRENKERPFLRQPTIKSLAGWKGS